VSQRRAANRFNSTFATFQLAAGSTPEIEVRFLAPLEPQQIRRVR